MELIVSTDFARLDLPIIHAFLAKSYWAKGIPRETLERALRGSLCFGAYRAERQLGFARAVTDGATFAYLADIFVVPESRERGVSRALMDAIIAHPDLQGLRRWMLATRDAHGLYAKYGFTPLSSPDRFMERWDPDVYAKRG